MTDSNIVPLVVEGRKAYRQPKHVDVLFMVPVASNADLMHDQNIQWIVHNFRAIIGERTFAFVAFTIGDRAKTGRDLLKNLQARTPEIAAALRSFRPKIIVAIGPEMAKTLNPNLASKADRNIVGYIHKMNDAPFTNIVVLPHLVSHNFVARNLDEILVTFIKVPFLLDNPHADKEGTIVDLDTDASANEYVDYLLHDYTGFLAYDTETRNLNKRYNNRLACMQFATDDHVGNVLYWNHDYNKRSREHDERVIKPKLKKIFGGHSKIRGLVAHYAQFDISSTRFGLGIDYWGIPTYDTVLLTCLMDQNRDRNDRITQPIPGNSANELKQLVHEFFGYDGYEAEAKAARKDGGLIDLPEPRLTKYSGQDGFAEFRLFKFILYWAKILNRREDLMRFAKYIHSGAIRTFQDMSYTGMLIDMPHVRELELPDSLINKELNRVKNLFKNDPVAQKANLALLKKKTNAVSFWQIPWVFDIAKPGSKSILFFDKENGLGLEPLEPGVLACDDKFQDKYKNIPQVKWLTEYSEVEKLRNTYISKMSIAITSADKKKTDLVDGRVHPNYNLNGTETGRLSCISVGTPVNIVRDMKILPHGVSIEKVKVGDLAYCLDNDDRITVRRVEASSQTGIHGCVKLTWSLRGITKELVLTPDHEVRTVFNGYVRADELSPRDLFYAEEIQHDLLEYQGAYAMIAVVDSIEPVEGEFPVYCLTIEDHHNFFADGVCVKNCQKPNLQQIPRADNDFKKAVKSVFTSPEGTIILQGDFAAAEVRMWGSLSQDRFLCELLTNSFNKRAAYRSNPTDKKLRDEAEIMADVHKQTASLMFGVPIEEVDKALRTITKGITFGLIYGRGVRSIAMQLGKTEEETQALCNKFFAQFPDGVAWLNEMKAFVQRNRYVETPFKRRRYLPWVKDEDQGLVASALRQSINTPVQSASGDYATLSISLLHEELNRRKLLKHFKLINAVHDSTLLEIPASVDALAEAATIMRDCFTVKSKNIAESVFGFEMKAPMDIDMEIAQRKAWKCSKCGHVYKAQKEKCDGALLGKDKKPVKDENGKDIKCSHTGRTEVKLNGGWGTLIGLDETMSGYREAALGF